MTMKISVLASIFALMATRSVAQQPGTAETDTWSIVTKAPDDRYTNPKSKLYNGPNGWYNFGEVRAKVSNAAKTDYSFQGGFHETTGQFVAAISGQLQVMSLDFGTDKPAVGTYQVSGTANVARKKVMVSFADVSGKKLKFWESADGAGAVTVSMVNGFLYVKFRNLTLQPKGMDNTGDFKKPMTIGFEGAIAPE